MPSSKTSPPVKSTLNTENGSTIERNPPISENKTQSPSKKPSVNDDISIDKLVERFAEAKVDHANDSEVENLTDSMSTKWLPYHKDTSKPAHAKWSWWADLFKSSK